MVNEAKLTPLEQEILSGKVLRRKDLPIEYTWDLTRLFKSTAEWEDQYRTLKMQLTKFKSFEGKLAGTPQFLAEYLNSRTEFAISLEKLNCHAALSHDSDTRDPYHLERLERVLNLEGEFDSATAFDEPEILAIGEVQIRLWLASTPELREFDFYLEELFRLSAHVRSSEVEEVLAQASELCQAPETIYEKLNDTDLSFEPFLKDNSERFIEQGNIEIYLVDRDRSVRSAAYRNYSKSYRQFENTFAACLAGEIKKSVFIARARKYSSTLECATKFINVPTGVFHNTIDTVRKNFPVWHRYWRARARALKLKKLAVYDIHASLSNDPPRVPYAQAVQYLLDGMKPLGAEYCEPLRRGLGEERWVDVFSNQDKRSNAYCSGAYGVNPYVLMNYGGTLSEMSTLAHEMGHAMHSYFSQANQNYLKSNYTLFVAEVASNFNQAMVRAQLLQNNDRDFKLAVLDEAFYNFHRYLFTMPILARFEFEVHSKVERGEGITSEYLKELMCDLLREGYGTEVEIDRDAAGMMWAQFGHFYVPFYVFQYTTGISAANALASNVLSGDQTAVHRYLKMLKAGGSKQSLDILMDAGVNMSSPEPINLAFSVLDRYVTELELLTC